MGSSSTVDTHGGMAGLALMEYDTDKHWVYRSTNGREAEGEKGWYVWKIEV